MPVNIGKGINMLIENKVQIKAIKTRKYIAGEIPRGHRLRHLQRWVNNRVIFRSCGRFEEYKTIQEETE